MTEFTGNHPTFSTKLNQLLAARPSLGGLPTDILLAAYDGYGDSPVPWEFVVNRASEIQAILAAKIPDAIIETSIHESSQDKRAAAAVSVFHLAAEAMPASNEAFLNGSTTTFVFWRWGVWMLWTNDVVGATGHLHRRIMTRASEERFSFTQLHDALSDLWPALVELGQVRRHLQNPANLTFFSVPLKDGLVCAEFQKLTSSDRFRPILRILEGQEVQDQRLDHPFSNGDDHLLVAPKTYITRLNSNQKKLVPILTNYLGKHQVALRYLKRRARLVYHDRVIGQAMQRTFNDDNAELVGPALQDLNVITRSAEWMEESERNRRSAEKAKSDGSGASTAKE